MNKFTRLILTAIVREIDDWKTTTIPPRSDWSYEGGRAYQAAVRAKGYAEEEIVSLDLAAFLVGQRHILDFEFSTADVSVARF